MNELFAILLPIAGKIIDISMDYGFVAGLLVSFWTRRWKKPSWKKQPTVWSRP